MVKTFFSVSDKVITIFIWNNRPPRICKTFLQRPGQKGGMVLANFEFCYFPDNIHSLLYCLSQPMDENPLWVYMKGSFSKISSLSARLTSSLSLDSSSQNENSILFNSLRIWAYFMKKTGLAAMSLFSPSENHYKIQLWNCRRPKALCLSETYVLMVS